MTDPTTWQDAAAQAELGLKHSENRLVAYDARWPAAFAYEHARLHDAVGHIATGIEHYGSTAVPGMPAKPILDILVGVTPLDAWADCHPHLLDLGYDYAAHVDVPGHHIFGRGRDETERTHLVHVVAFEGTSWRSNLAFRDALRRDAHLRQAYSAAKTAAITAAPEGRGAYNVAKSGFIDDIKAGLSW